MISFIFLAQIPSAHVYVAIVELRNHLIPAILSLSVVGQLLTRSGIAAQYRSMLVSYYITINSNYLYDIGNCSGIAV